MKQVIRAIGSIALTVLLSAAAPQKAPDWAYPEGRAPPPVGGWDNTRRVSLYGAGITFTDAQVRDRTHAVDWLPNSHPPMPGVVSSGRPPDVLACGFCHLPAGEGRPENAALAGLPRDYIVRQVRDFASGARISVVRDWGPSALMSDLARHVTAAEASAAADYFSRLKFTSRVRVVETSRIARPTATNFLLVPGAHQRPEPLGRRIVEGPSSLERWERRDPRIAYTAYVPLGSLRRGAILAAGAAGVPACASCHGIDLKGGSLGPPLAGRSPSYLFRQLYAFRVGARTGPDAAPMQAVTARMSQPDMIALAAYVASKTP